MLLDAIAYVLFFIRGEEVSQGFHEIMEAYKQEVTFLFYQEDSGIRDQVFKYFYTEYHTDVEQKLATFQTKYGSIIERQDRVLREVCCNILLIPSVPGLPCEHFTFCTLHDCAWKENIKKSANGYHA